MIGWLLECYSDMFCTRVLIHVKNDHSVEKFVPKSQILGFAANNRMSEIVGSSDCSPLLRKELFILLYSFQASPTLKNEVSFETNILSVYSSMLL